MNARMNNAKKIVVIDYGAGNLRSVARAVMHAGGEPTVTADPHEVGDAGALIVPAAFLGSWFGYLRVAFRVRKLRKTRDQTVATRKT